jgi:cob(I)alamin adenosyltransferase
MASEAPALSAAGSVSTSQKRFKVYTKTGDKGTSSLYTGERRPKDDAIFNALGDVDELNSSLGVAFAHIQADATVSGAAIELSDQLIEIQSRLFDVGSAVATPLSSGSDEKLAKVVFSDEAVTHLESWIDRMEEELPRLTNFILPVRMFPGWIALAMPCLFVLAIRPQN